MASGEIVELGPDDSRMPAALAVMGELRADRSVEDLERLLAEARERGEYRIAGLFEAGECRAVAGFRVATSFAYGRHLFVDDLVTADAQRSRGHGERLEEHLRSIARAEGCGAIRLNSGLARRRAHRFYFRRGYAIDSFHFGCSLERG